MKGWELTGFPPERNVFLQAAPEALPAVAGAEAPFSNRNASFASPSSDT
jgi:hypothetical protein